MSALFFTRGCNFRCGYCHNPDLVVPEQYLDTLKTQAILDFLKSRSGKLDAVVISGGEPTLHKDLPEFIRQLKAMGYLVKLDSNGSHPEVIARLIDQNLLDFIAMDIKGPLKKYASIMGWAIDTSLIKRSVQIIISSGIAHEFRTTIVKSQLTTHDFAAIGQLINGADRYALQHFKPNRSMVDTEKFQNQTTYNDKDFQAIQTILQKYVKTCVIH